MYRRRFAITNARASAIARLAAAMSGLSAVGRLLLGVVAQSNLSHREIARRANIGTTTIAAVLAGQQDPRLSSLERLAAVLAVPLPLLFQPPASTGPTPPALAELEMLARLIRSRIGEIAPALHGRQARR